jgi:hypothetical protein
MLHSYIKQIPVLVVNVVLVVREVELVGDTIKIHLPGVLTFDLSLVN